jgi:hypothetical protein
MVRALAVVFACTALACGSANAPLPRQVLRFRPKHPNRPKRA